MPNQKAITGLRIPALRAQHRNSRSTDPQKVHATGAVAFGVLTEDHQYVYRIVNVSQSKARRLQHV